MECKCSAVGGMSEIFPHHVICATMLMRCRGLNGDFKLVFAFGIGRIVVLDVWYVIVWV